jgi:hypothetical protein
MAPIDTVWDVHQYKPDTVMESRQSAEASERQLLSVLSARYRLNGTPEEKLRLLRAKKVDENVFIVGTDRVVSFFYDGKWDMLLSLKELRTVHYFLKASYLAGYREIPSDSKPVDLYRIKDLDDKGNPVSGAKPVDKFSREYYQAFMDITFYDDKLIIETFKKESSDTNTYTPLDTKPLLSIAKWWAMRIRDLVAFKKTGQTTDSDFTTALSILQKNLLNTIGDYRFERVNQGVKREELDSYLKDGLISKELHAQAIQKLERVEKIKRAVSDKHSQIMNQTQVKMAGLMSERSNLS